MLPQYITCKKAKTWLDDNEFRDIKLDTPTLAELTE